MRRNTESSDLEPIDLEPATDAVVGGRTPSSAGTLHRGARTAAAVVASLALVVTAWAGIRVAEAQETQACVDRAQTFRMFGGGGGSSRAGQESAEAVLRRQLEECGIEAPPSRSTRP